MAQRFAAAVFHGQSDAAVQLLIHPDDAALSQLARHAARPWKTAHARLLLPARRAGRHWIFRYTGRQTHADGRFEDVRGHITVILGATGVEFFTLRNDDIRFSTHHDSQLLPSNR